MAARSVVFGIVLVASASWAATTRPAKTIPKTVTKSKQKKKTGATTTKEKSPAPAETAPAVVTPVPATTPAVVTPVAVPAPAPVETGHIEGVATVVSEAPEPPHSNDDRVFLTVSGSIEWGARNVGYRDRLSSTLSGYRGAMPLAEARAEIYPAANTTIPVVRDLGIVGRWSHSFAGTTATSDDAVHLTTNWMRYGVGARWRLRLAGREWGGVTAAYGGSSFDFKGTSLAPAVLPDGNMSEFRLGLDGRIPLGPLNLGLSVAGMLPRGLSLGAVFPKASVGGIDGAISLSYRIARYVELSASVQYVRYFWKLNPEPGDPYVAGGAIDEQLFSDVRVAFVL